MVKKNLEKLSSKEILGIKMYLLNNCKSKTSAIKGKTAIDLGYSKDDIKALELKFDYLFGTDNVTIFCQKSNDSKGKGFTIEGVDKNLFEVVHRYYMDTRSERLNKKTDILDILSSNNQEDIYIDPDLIDEREYD